MLVKCIAKHMLTNATKLLVKTGFRLIDVSDITSRAGHFPNRQFKDCVPAFVKTILAVAL